MTFNPLPKEVTLPSQLHSLDDYAEAHGEGVDNTLALLEYDIAVRDFARLYNATLNIPANEYQVNAREQYSSIIGQGSSSLLSAYDPDKPILRLARAQPKEGGDYRSIRNIRLKGSGASDGIEINPNTTQGGQWIFENVKIAYVDAAIKKTRGNYGHIYKHMSVHNANFGIYAKSDPVMQAGNDHLTSGEFHIIYKAGWYIDSEHEGTGALLCRDMIMQGCEGFGIFWKFSTNFTYPPTRVTPVIENTYFEAMASVGTVSIDGVDYTPRDIRIDNAQILHIKNCTLDNVEFNNSTIVADGCYITQNATVIVDDDSSLVSTNTRINGRVPSSVMVQSVESIGVRNHNPLYEGIFKMPLKEAYSNAYGTVMSGESFNGAGPWTFTNGVNPTTIAGGVISDTCANVIVPDGVTTVFETVTLELDKWYVATAHVKRTTSLMSVSFTGTEVFGSITLESQKWVCYVGIKKGGGGTTALTFTNNSGVDAKVHLADVSIIEFDKEQEAIAYANTHTVRVS